MNENYDDIYRIDAGDEWENSAYDEDGMAAVCDVCGEEMKWSPSERNWFCPSCGRDMGRAEYFNHIGAEPPGSRCMTNCSENYPACKLMCPWYEIDPDDPMAN